MADFEYEADHVKHSIGGRGGHIFRRIFHVFSKFFFGDNRRPETTLNGTWIDLLMGSRGRSKNH